MNYFVTCDWTLKRECYMENDGRGSFAVEPILLSRDDANALVLRHLQHTPNHHKHPRIYQEDGILVSGPAPDNQSMAWLREINAPRRNIDSEPE